MDAPFPYFGGKASVAPIVWDALGDVKHYIEPCFGSGAVLLSRPGYDPTRHIETICDKDGFVSNVWRSLQFSPDEVARWCDWPVNHADLSARRKALQANETRLLQNLEADPQWHDPVIAGYWIWAASCWIGAGLTCPHAIPDISRGGRGVQIPDISRGGTGVHAIGKRPHLTSGGRGVYKPGMRSDFGEDAPRVQDPYNRNIYAWFRELSERLRYVRVVCGDWIRVCGGNWQNSRGTVGIFFDPPYGVTDRYTAVYHEDSVDVAHAVRAWCLERGHLPDYRIVLAGYEEHEEEMQAAGWRVHAWKAHGGYAQGGTADSPGKRNSLREKLYISPNCVNNRLFE